MIPLFVLSKETKHNYNTTIETMSDEMNPKTAEEELFEKIISLLHCFSMREYSHRRSERKLIEETLKRKEMK